MTSKYSNNFLVFKGIEEKTMLAQQVPDYSFFINKKRYLETFVILSKAFESKELLLPPRKYMDKKMRKKLEKQH